VSFLGVEGTYHRYREKKSARGYITDGEFYEYGGFLDLFAARVSFLTFLDRLHVDQGEGYTDIREGVRLNFKLFF
jgi:hypothetical protein